MAQVHGKAAVGVAARVGCAWICRRTGKQRGVERGIEAGWIHATQNYGGRACACGVAAAVGPAVWCQSGVRAVKRCMCMQQLLAAPLHQEAVHTVRDDV
jgi:hypothetical protein